MKDEAAHKAQSAEYSQNSGGGDNPDVSENRINKEKHKNAEKQTDANANVNDPESPTAEKPDADYIRRRRITSVISIAVLLLFFGAVFWFVGKPLIASLEHPEEFRLWVESHGVWSKFAMVGMMALQMVIAIIPGEPMELGAGYAFGTWEGLALCLVGALIGSAIVFVFTRKFGIKLVEAFVSREKINSVKFLRDSKKLELLTFIIFLIPGTPKDVITYIAGITNIKMSRFLLITTVARIPSVITSTLAGSALGESKYKLAVIVFAATIVISGIGILIYRRIGQRDAKTADGGTDEKDGGETK